MGQKSGVLFAFESCVDSIYWVHPHSRLLGFARSDIEKHEVNASCSLCLAAAAEHKTCWFRATAPIRATSFGWVSVLSTTHCTSGFLSALVTPLNMLSSQNPCIVFFSASMPTGSSALLHVFTASLCKIAAICHTGPVHYFEGVWWDSCHPDPLRIVGELQVALHAPFLQDHGDAGDSGDLRPCPKII